jgi:hypothetical protein
VTTINFICIGALVKAALAARLEFEVLHRIGDENRLALDAGINQGLGQNTACGADEWSTLLLFLIPRLLANQHEPRARRTFPGYNLGGVLIERAACAFLFGRAQRFQ